ncbi:MAG: hypothetical protein K1X94_19030 [Sandaracinaceae bacterium]|nr:hypothetical protein [Sandaracinaceae bacterium]
MLASTLVRSTVSTKAMGTTQKAPVNATTPLIALARRVVVTLGAMAAYVFMRNVPAPGLDLATFEELGGSAMVSVVTLGVGNLTTGALLVELAAWVVARRDLERRARLRARWVRPAALGLAALQSVGVVMWISSLTPTLDRPPFVPMLGAPLLVGATFVAGVALIALGLEAITRWGIGNGFTVWVVFESASSMIEIVRAEGFEALVVPAAIVTVALGTFALATRSRAAEESPSIRIPPSGILPLNLGVFAMVQLAAPLFAAALVVGAAALALGRFWHVGRGPGGVGPAHVWGALVLVAAFITFDLLGRDERGDVVWHAAGVLVALAAGIDLVAEIRARARLGELTTLVSEQRIDAADVLATRLRAAGIEVHLRALHHRTMLQWLGPYVPVEVLVPVAEEGAARAVLAGLGAYR